MSVTITEDAFIVSGGQTVDLSSIVSVSASTTNPTYLVVSGLDRDEYTAAATDVTGSLSGNGNTASFSAIDSSDGRGVGIVFTYQASTGRYYNSSYGYLDQLTYTASTSLNDVTNLSIFTTNSLSIATNYANDPYDLAQLDASGYVGSATIVTLPNYTAAIPTQATPESIVAAAESFVGKAWNMDGCWILASTIAAEAGTSLPVQSSMIDMVGHANGEWIVAFNGPAGDTGNWESLVKPGEMIVIANATSGHITTVVSGSGSSAMVIDNVTYETANGTITNLADDGSSNDVTISAAHLLSAELTGVTTSSVVIYELDTPVITSLVTSDAVAINSSQSLAHLFSATDPGDKTITEYQVYDSATGDHFTVNGVTETAHSSSSAVTVSSLSSISLATGGSIGTDTLEIRAYNGSYWGDWQSLSVTVATSVAPSPPTVTDQTASQTWHQGQAVSLTLASDTFTDPQGEALTLKASLSNGSALPSWLTFNSSTDSFSGTVPSGTGSFSVTVTATDSSDLSVSETFAVTVPASSPLLVVQTPTQSWVDGRTVSLTLAANSFSDPQGESLTYTAWQESGRSVGSWLHFNASSLTFSGTVPTNLTGTVELAVEATDTSGLSAWDDFLVTFSQGSVSASHLVGTIDLASSHPTQLTLA